MKLIIIDDEPLARSIVREYISSMPDMEIVAECNDGFEGLKAIQEFQPDLVFLDIQMPKINGFEMLELLEKPPAVIFTTAFDEFAIKAFEINAVDYLLKPFSNERFCKAIEKFRQQTEQPFLGNVLDTASSTSVQQNRVVVKDGNKIRIIPVTKIQYIEAADDYVKIYTAEGAFLKKRTMAFFENSLSSYNFIRIHRSCLVNSQLITRIEPYEKESYLVILNTGARLPVSKTGYSRLREVLGI